MEWGGTLKESEALLWVRGQLGPLLVKVVTPTTVTAGEGSRCWSPWGLVGKTLTNISLVREAWEPLTNP